MTFEIVVYDTPPSNNEFMGNSRNFNEYRRQKEAWHWLMKAAIKKKPKVPIKRALVEIKYYFKIRRRRDPDNYSGKFILDPLVNEGILQDDSFGNVELRLWGGFDKVNPRTEIKVTEIAEEKRKVE